MSENKIICQFLALGDWGGNRNSFNGCSEKFAVAKQMGKVFQEHSKDAECFFVAALGDNFYMNGVVSVDDSQWKTDYSDVYSSTDCPWYPVLGNHDWHGNPQAQIDFKKDGKWQMDSLYYDKVIGNVHFLFIDTPTLCPERSNSMVMNIFNPNQVFVDKDRDVQMKWIEETLSSSTSEWIIVFGHYPIHSGGAHGCQRLTKEMIVVETLLKKFKVDAYFCGHDHSLQHIHNDELQMHHFGSGAGVLGIALNAVPDKTVWCDRHGEAGFANVTIDSKEMKVTFINSNGDKLHTAVVPKQEREIGRVVPISAVPAAALYSSPVSITDPFNSEPCVTEASLDAITTLLNFETVARRESLSLEPDVSGSDCMESGLEMLIKATMDAVTEAAVDAAIEAAALETAAEIFVSETNLTSVPTVCCGNFVPFGSAPLLSEREDEVSALTAVPSQLSGCESQHASFLSPRAKRKRADEGDDMHDQEDCEEQEEEDTISIRTILLYESFSQQSNTGTILRASCSAAAVTSTPSKERLSAFYPRKERRYFKWNNPLNNTPSNRPAKKRLLTAATAGAVSASTGSPSKRRKVTIRRQSDILVAC